VDPPLRPHSCTDQFPHGRGRSPAFDFEYHSKSGELAWSRAVWLTNRCVVPQHIAVDIKRIYSGLVLYRDTYPGGPVAWFANEREPSFVFKNIVYPIQTALGDGVVVRIFLIFGTLSSLFPLRYIEATWFGAQCGLLWSLSFCG
jgi:hypothetical protein